MPTDYYVFNASNRQEILARIEALLKKGPYTHQWYRPADTDTQPYTSKHLEFEKITRNNLQIHIHDTYGPLPVPYSAQIWLDENSVTFRYAAPDGVMVKHVCTLEG